MSQCNLHLTHHVQCTMRCTCTPLKGHTVNPPFRPGSAGLHTQRWGGDNTNQNCGHKSELVYSQVAVSLSSRWEKRKTNQIVSNVQTSADQDCIANRLQLSVCRKSSVVRLTTLIKSGLGGTGKVLASFSFVVVLSNKPFKKTELYFWVVFHISQACNMMIQTRARLKEW